MERSLIRTHHVYRQYLQVLCVVYSVLYKVVQYLPHRRQALSRIFQILPGEHAIVEIVVADGDTSNPGLELDVPCHFFNTVRDLEHARLVDCTAPVLLEGELHLSVGSHSGESQSTTARHVSVGGHDASRVLLLLVAMLGE